ncbi:MAG TPA: DUF3800 domain-containing protein [Thermoanaerobaculia bacterium]|jgi:hypothetical protein|nr:DUF3800 domain-containing protein [Thermoanaerobaculia bacterium]
MEREKKRRFRLYVDESGDHTFSLADDDNHRYLGLLGVWFDSEAPYMEFARALGDLKREIFGWHPDDPPICFHRNDILRRKHAYGRLREPEVNGRFEAGLLKVVREASFCTTCVVIDKATYRTKAYRELFHPYHYCIAVLVERYVGWLNHFGGEGDVVAESRGRSEDHELLDAFELALQNGTRFREPQSFQQVLTSTKIKLKKKEHTVPGLELADLLAHPFKREMVAERRGEQPPEDFGSALLNAARAKMNCHPSTGHVMGYGKVWLD